MTNIIYLDFHRGNLRGESKNSLVLEVGKIKVWLAKKMVKTSDFTLMASAGIIDSYDYSIVDTQDVIKGDKLIELMKAEFKIK